MAELRSEVSENARLDLAIQYAWYLSKAGPEIAERFLESFRRSVALLVFQPGTGVLRRFRHPRLGGIRSFQLGAPFCVHLLFYRVEDESLVVFRVLHGMRDLPRRLLESPGFEDAEDKGEHP